MDKYWEFFEDLDEFVYVTDVESCEIVYMNRCARMAFGCPSPEDYQNKKCYQVLQNRTEPCAFCTTKRLQKGKFYRWSYTNPCLKRTYALKDTLVELGGRTYRLELAIDMGVRRETQSGEPESAPETPFQTFVRHNYFDAEAFFKSDRKSTRLNSSH